MSSRDSEYLHNSWNQLQRALHLINLSRRTAFKTSVTLWRQVVHVLKTLWRTVDSTHSSLMHLQNTTKPLELSKRGSEFQSKTTGLYFKNKLSFLHLPISFLHPVHPSIIRKCKTKLHMAMYRHMNQREIQLNSRASSRRDTFVFCLISFLYVLVSFTAHRHYFFSLSFIFLCCYSSSTPPGFLLSVHPVLLNLSTERKSDFRLSSPP